MRFAARAHLKRISSAIAVCFMHSVLLSRRIPSHGEQFIDFARRARGVTTVEPNGKSLFIIAGQIACRSTGSSGMVRASCDRFAFDINPIHIQMGTERND